VPALMRDSELARSSRRAVAFFGVFIGDIIGAAAVGIEVVSSARLDDGGNGPCASEAVTARSSGDASANNALIASQ